MTLEQQPSASGWHGWASLNFHQVGERTVHQGGAVAPLRLQRARGVGDGRCELPILHTAGGLVGGDRLSLELQLEPGARALVTSVAAQKVYGAVGRSRLAPEGRWARQELVGQLAAGADLEWLPQELVVFANGLYEQHQRLELAPGASWLGAEVVRLGRTAAGETLERGRWRSRLEIRRRDEGIDRWELVDRLELGGEALISPHGLSGEPVLGSLVWAAPEPLAAEALATLLAQARADRAGLAGEMGCGALEQGLVARYRGPSSQAARFWFTRLWVRIRACRGLAPPELPRCWPFQEQPLAGIQPTAGVLGEPDTPP
ncbi:MAG: urease accessory protein UreD [Cyanobacteriota bacterium]|nr:urease accessory protein UreD [Cyanobacteriota bacterium]